MKKTFFFLLTLMLCVGMLAGCSQNGENKSDKITVYSFCGENEQFAVTNGWNECCAAVTYDSQ